MNYLKGAQTINHQIRPYKSTNNGIQNQGNHAEQLPTNLSKYLLEDYTFLSEYQLLDSQINSESQFLAKIKDTQQMVRFIKRQLLPTNTPKGLSMYRRFQAMFALFQKGVILADNMFILAEGMSKFYYYIIEPYLSLNNNPNNAFITLQQYLSQNRLALFTFQSRKTLFLKAKLLLDNLSNLGQAYYGLNSKNIVVDDQGNLFLLPFSLQPKLTNKPYERSYYPPQILQSLTSSQNKSMLKSMQKWDIWSFGCITAEIFLYLTPYYMSTSVQKQISKTKAGLKILIQDFKAQFINQSSSTNVGESSNNESQCSIQQHLGKQFEQTHKILNFFINSFDSDLGRRSMSFQLPEGYERQANFRSRTSRAKSSVKRMIQRRRQSKQQDKPQQTKKQLNFRFLCQQTGDPLYKQLNKCTKSISNSQDHYTFQLKLLSVKLFNMQFDKEQVQQQIRITVCFSTGQIFNFFLDFKKRLSAQQDQNQEMQQNINKKITFYDKSLQEIQKLLEQDIQIQIKPNNVPSDNVGSQFQKKCKQISQIYVNLSALTMKNQKGRRLWRKPIKGTYATQKGQHSRCKIRLQANIMGSDQQFGQNQSQVKPEPIQQALKSQQFKLYKQQSEQTQKSNQSCKKSLSFFKIQSKMGQNPNFQSQKSRKSSVSKFESINSQIDQISKFWKQKIQLTESNQSVQLRQLQQNRKSENKQSKRLSGKNLSTNKIAKENKQNHADCRDLSRKLKRLLIN